MHTSINYNDIVSMYTDANLLSNIIIHQLLQGYGSILAVKGNTECPSVEILSSLYSTMTFEPSHSKYKHVHILWTHKVGT